MEDILEDGHKDQTEVSLDNKDLVIKDQVGTIQDLLLKDRLEDIQVVDHKVRPAMYLVDMDHLEDIQVVDRKAQLGVKDHPKVIPVVDRKDQVMEVFLHNKDCPVTHQQICKDQHHSGQDKVQLVKVRQKDMLVVDHKVLGYSFQVSKMADRKVQDLKQNFRDLERRVPQEAFLVRDQHHLLENIFLQLILNKIAVQIISFYTASKETRATTNI